ncbi:MAG: hypothetical protein ACK4M3_02175 [Pyrobaculum sp.]
MKVRGAILVEEVLLILISVALISAFALTLSGVIQGAVDKILGFRNATETFIHDLGENIKRLLGFG